MKIALIADIHANLSALRSVLNDLPTVDLLLCAGDVVGYYADPNEVCHLLRQSGALVIRGNHEAYVLGELQPYPEKSLAYRTDWTRQSLTPEHLSWLSSLPTEMVFQWGEEVLRLRHANPWDEETYLYRDSADLQKIFLGHNQVLVVGHTHHPMLIQCGAGIVINPGSVGQPRDWNPLASYALFDAVSGHVDFRRVSYDVTGLQSRLIDLHWDKTAISILSRSR